MIDDNSHLHDVYFEVRFPFDPRRDLVWKEVCRFLQKRYVQKESRILDLGAGYCNFINNIEGTEKHCLDISNSLPDWANPDVIPHIGSCTELGFFDDDCFDVVFASNLFEHLTKRELADTLNQVSRILRPRGRLIALQPNFRYCYKVYFDDFTHTQIFTAEGLRDLLYSHGFGAIDVLPRFLPVNMKSTLRVTPPKLHLLTRLYLNLPFRPFAGQMLLVTENLKT